MKKDQRSPVERNKAAKACLLNAARWIRLAIKNRPDLDLHPAREEATRGTGRLLEEVSKGGPQ
jgi:hypothetical protein